MFLHENHKRIDHSCKIGCPAGFVIVTIVSELDKLVDLFHLISGTTYPSYEKKG